MTRRVVISIDFELRWGVYDVLGSDLTRYRANLEGVEEVVPRLLELFEAYRVRATWATVAALACESWEEYRVRAPPPPLYFEKKLLPPEGLEQKDPAGRLHFAPALVRLLAGTASQELASHSFSHFFFGEPGFVRADAERDCVAVAACLREKFGRTPTSFVFPRNQVAFTEVLLAHGLHCVRTNPPGRVWRAPVALAEWLPFRLARFAGSFAGTPGARPSTSECPASTFLRLQLPEPLFWQHRRAIAARAGSLASDEVLHLWFHPHNLGDAPARRVAQVGSVLDAIVEGTRGEVAFQSMRDVCAEGPA